MSGQATGHILRPDRPHTHFSGHRVAAETTGHSSTFTCQSTTTGYCLSHSPKGVGHEAVQSGDPRKKVTRETHAAVRNPYATIFYGDSLRAT